MEGLIWTVLIVGAHSNIIRRDSNGLHTTNSPLLFLFDENQPLTKEWIIQTMKEAQKETNERIDNIFINLINTPSRSAVANIREALDVKKELDKIGGVMKNISDELIIAKSDLIQNFSHLVLF